MLDFNLSNTFINCMNQNFKEKLFFSLKIIIPLIIVIFLFLAGVSVGVITFEPPEKKSQGEISALIEIKVDNQIILSKELTLINATVLDFLLELEKLGDISLKKTYWEQFESYVIDSITYKTIEYEADTNHYWSYYINDEAGLVGADQQIVNDENKITWNYEEF